MTSPDTASIPVTASYDSLDRPTTLTYTLPAQAYTRAGATYFTSWSYDANGNVSQQEIDGRVDPTSGQPQAGTGRVQTCSYDTASRLLTQVDKGMPVDSALSPAPPIQPDQQYAFSWFETGWMQSRAVRTNTGAQMLKTTWDYFLDGQVKSLTTMNGNNATVESHTASYDDPASGKYVGFRTRDQFAVASPGPNPQCATFASPCTATYTYDPRGRLTDATTSYGQTFHYDLDPAGNVTHEVASLTDRLGVVQTTTRDYT